MGRVKEGPGHAEGTMLSVKSGQLSSGLEVADSDEIGRGWRAV
jgi:hypothetical protein